MNVLFALANLVLMFKNMKMMETISVQIKCVNHVYSNG